MAPRRAFFCKNCPFRRSSPKAGEPGGSVPEYDPAGMRQTVHEITEGGKVMQCHDSAGEEPRPCAGFLSVVGYESVGVRLAVALGHIDHEDIGMEVPGLYGSLREMLREADHIDLDEKT